MYYYEEASEKNWFRPENLKRITICIIFIIVVLLLKKVNMPIFKTALSKIEYYLCDYSYEYQDIVEAVKNISEAPDKIPVLSQGSSKLLPMPVHGSISSEYGLRLHPILKQQQMHKGIDIVEKEGAPVKVVIDGVVDSVGYDEELGNTVKISHGNGLTTVYAHLKDVYVKEKETVKQGFIIGTIGNTGLSKTAHLHFEIWKDGKAEDPRKWLNIQDNTREDLDGFKGL